MRDTINRALFFLMHEFFSVDIIIIIIISVTLCAVSLSGFTPSDSSTIALVRRVFGSQLPVLLCHV